MTPARPILVTGAHRSGTGWISRVMASSGEAAYLWEPFSPMHRPGICDAEFPLWFTYVCAENESAFLKSIGDMLEFRYKTGAELRVTRTPRDAARLVRDRLRFRRYRRRDMRPLLKDPIAVFSAEWLHHTFDSDVVLLIRHPAGFAWSLKKRGWDYPFDHFLRQPLLMRDLLGPFDSQLRLFSQTPHDVVDQSILLWSLIHHVIRHYRQRYPDWMFLRLEDVARDPLGSFKEVFGRLGLDFGDPVEAMIEDTTDPRNPRDPSDPASVKRDSRTSVYTWRRGLTSEEIARVKAGAGPLCAEFYGDEDW